MEDAAIFLDRDGTINEEVDFLISPQEIKLIPGSAQAIREAKELGYKVFIITNQSGIARGLFTEIQLKKINSHLISVLMNHGADIDAIYYCPHHPDFGDSTYRQNCECRKPKTGMITQAAKEFNIDLKKSFIIGDRTVDVQTGNNSGMTTILVLTGYGEHELELCQQYNAHIDHVAPNLYEAFQYIKQFGKSEQEKTSLNNPCL